MALTYNMRALAQSDNSYVFWESSTPDPIGTNAPEAIIADTASVIGVTGESSVDTEWTSYSPTITATPSPSTGSDGSVTGQWRREGDSIRVRMTWSFGTVANGMSAGSGTYIFNLLNGLSLTVDESKLASIESNPGGFLGTAPVGFGYAGDISTAANRTTCAVFYNTGSNTFSLFANKASSLNFASPFAWGEGDIITMEALVPILEYATG